MITNPFVLVVALLQIGGGIYSIYIGDWKMAVLNVGVGIANGVLSTMKG